MPDPTTTDDDAAQQALRARPAYRHREELAEAFEDAAFATGTIATELGTWAARGSFAALPEDARRDAGLRALSEIDDMVRELGRVHERLAAMLAATRDGASA